MKDFHFYAKHIFQIPIETPPFEFSTPQQLTIVHPIVAATYSRPQWNHGLDQIAEP